MDAGHAALAVTPLADALAELAVEHETLEALLAAHLDRVVAGDFAAALQRFDAFASRLRAHLRREEATLFPALAQHPAPRWPLRVYQAEHDRLRLLLCRHRRRLEAPAAAAAEDPIRRRAEALALIDAIHPLRHVLEHHQQREHSGLFAELA
jgi:iron-sulfur cluster repair protein YtfE (RIC family)